MDTDLKLGHLSTPERIAFSEVLYYGGKKSGGNEVGLRQRAAVNRKC